MLDRQIRFRHLQCFLAVAEHRSVGRAADALAISQPAVSKALSEVENHLGVELFHRESRGMFLTEFGKLFLKHASVSVESLRRGIDDIRAASTNGSAGVSVGVMPNMAGRIMPLAVARFRRHMPNAVLRVVDGGNQGVLEQLRLGEIDFVVGRLSQPEYLDDVVFELLFTESIAMVVRPGHALAEAAVIDADALRRFPLIYPDEHTNIGHQVRRYLMGLGMKPTPGAIFTTSTAFSRGLVGHSDALWFVGRGTVHEELALGTLIELPADTHELEGPVGITTRADSPLTASAEALLDAIRSVCRELLPSSRNCGSTRSLALVSHTG